MSSRKARLSALAAAAVFVMVGATGAYAQGTGGTGAGATGTTGTGEATTGGGAITTTTGDVVPLGGQTEGAGAGAVAQPTLDAQPSQPGVQERMEPAATEPVTQPEPAQPATVPLTEPATQPMAQPGVQTQVQPTMELQTTEFTAARITDPQQVTVPPQSRGPLTVGSFNAAVRLQSANIARLNRLGTNIPGQRITVINVRNLNPGPPSAATARPAGAVPTTGIDNAVAQAEARSASAAQTAARNNTAVANALAQANIPIENVLALAVRGHQLNDVTVYHR